MEGQPVSVMRRAIPLIIFAVVSTSLVTGSYLFLQRFLADRQSAMTPARRATNGVTQRREVRTDAKGGSKDPARAPNVPGQPAANAGEAAIQRQLKTLEEINRINEMNRRLMEQQRRMQNQR